MCGCLKMKKAAIAAEDKRRTAFATQKKARCRMEDTTKKSAAAATRGGYAPRPLPRECNLLAMNKEIARPLPRKLAMPLATCRCAARAAAVATINWESVQARKAMELTPEGAHSKPNSNYSVRRRFASLEVMLGDKPASNIVEWSWAISALAGAAICNAKPYRSAKDFD